MIEYKIGAIVRARGDNAIGSVLGSHRHLPDEPLQILVRWRDNHAHTWHLPETLELVTELAAFVNDPANSEGCVMPDPEFLRQQIGRRLAEIRARYGMSQRAFAPFVGLRNAYLADIETGRSEMTVSTLVQICSKLELDPNELLMVKHKPMTRIG